MAEASAVSGYCQGIDRTGGSTLAMTKSELIEVIARKQKHLPAKDVELAVKHLLELMSGSWLWVSV